MSVESRCEAAARPLTWNERGLNRLRWWETAPAGTPGPRAVVIWLRRLGRVAWWIADGEVAFGDGYVPSLDEPGNELLDQAKLAAEQRWRELGL